jgi:hypothetical protein
MKCIFCGEDETLGHRIAQCVNWECVEARNIAIAKFKLAISEHLKSKKGRKVAEAEMKYLKILLEVNCGMAWLGLWFDEHSIQISNAINSCSLDGSQYRMLIKTLKTLHYDATNIYRAYTNALINKEADKGGSKYEIEPLFDGDIVHSNESDSGSESEESTGKNQEEEVQLREMRVEYLKKRAASMRWATRREEGVKKAKLPEEEAGNPRANEIYVEVIATNAFEDLGPTVIDARPTLVTAAYVKMKDRWKRRKKKER